MSENETPGLGTGNGGVPAVAHTLRSEGHDASEDGTGRGIPLVASPLSHGSNPNSNAAGRRREDDENLVSYALNRYDGDSETFVPAAASVRRLTPRECERLQGLADDWTLIPGAADSPRYAALGDAVTATVSHWIGDRLHAVSVSVPARKETP